MEKRRLLILKIKLPQKLYNQSTNNVSMKQENVLSSRDDVKFSVSIKGVILFAASKRDNLIPGPMDKANGASIPG